MIAEHDGWHSRFVRADQVEASQQGPGSQPPAAVELVDDSIGYVALESYHGADEEDMVAWALDTIERIGSIAPAADCGWIVDLWNHRGGNMWPGLAGLLPLLASGTVASFVAADGSSTPVRVADGSDLLGDDVMLGLPRVVERISGERPIAVIVSFSTASSCEALALAFRGRPMTRLVGRETTGVASAVEGFPLTDGSYLFVATALMVDRTGDGPEIGHGIQPDELPTASHQMAAVEHAAEWIRTQCSEPGS